MPLTNAGRDFIAAAIVDDPSATFFDAANARLGAGDGTAAFDAAQVDLQAATNKRREPVDDAPSLAGNVITFVATFPPFAANFAWEEFGIFNAPSGGTMLTRKVEALGTKTDAEEWELTVDVTVSVGT